MPPEPQEDFAGIDPVQLKAMIGDMETARSMIDQRMPRLKDDFARAGLDAKHISALAGVSSWIGGELPMLKRRHSMAEQLSKENNQYGFTGAMVQTEWEGLFKSKEEAQAKAKELAGKYQEPGGFPDGVWEQIGKYQFDPDFAEAFLKELGPEKAAWITARLRTWDEKEHDVRLAAFGRLVGVASHRGLVTEDWLKRFSTEKGRGPALYDLAALIRQGTWDKDALVLIGGHAVSSMQLGGGNTVTADILDGVARNPFAASKLYTDRFQEINAIVSGARPGWAGVKDGDLIDPLARFVTAATVTAKDTYEMTRPPGNTGWINPADILIGRILTLQKSKHGFGSPFGPVQKALDAVRAFDGKVVQPNPDADAGGGGWIPRKPPPDPTLPMDWKDVAQGGLGDCYFLAAVQAEIRRDPQFLAKRMTLNADGTYDVTFFKDGKPVVMKVNSDSYSAGVDPPLLSIYEKAYAMFKGGNSFEAIEGGHVTDPWPDINGKKRKELDSSAITYDRLKQLNDQKVPITVGTPDDSLWFDDDQRTGPHKDIVTNHVYVLGDVFKDANGQEMVKLVNPWGKYASAPQEVVVPLSWLRSESRNLPRWSVDVMGGE
ncbi:C2 family cysteine protease [Nonomuraea sp. NPDC050556]|uniref:C2 family cysteine protease n=1 Tax=Nonomuraea sp. NPDC050556 TaxID=3364369 RepID=UPI003791B2BA